MGIGTEEASGPQPVPRSDRRSRGSMARFSHLDAIESRCRVAGNGWDEYVERCLERYHASTELVAKTKLLKRIAHALDHGLSDPQQAFDALVEAFSLDPSDAETVSSLELLTRRLHGWTELVTTTRLLVDEEPDPKRKLVLCEHGARWCRQELNSSQEAETFLVEIHRIDPSHSLVRRRLASFYREQGIWDLRRDELERALLSAQRADERREIHEALGELYEIRFNQLAHALRHYEAAAECDPGRLEPLEGVERVCYRLEMFGRVLDVLHRQLEISREAPQRYALSMRLADLYERHFLKPNDAIPLLWEALVLNPGDAIAFDALQRCYRGLRAWPEYVDTIERRLEHVDDRETKIAFLIHIAQVVDTALHDPTRAIDAYRRAHELDPRNTTVIVEVARLADRAGDWHAAATFRAKLAELTDDSQKLVPLHLAIGELLEAPDRDPVTARAHYERVIGIDPTHLVAWEKLQNLAMQAGSYRRAAFCLMERAQHTPVPRTKARLFVELGKLWEEPLKATNHARSAYELALQHDPGNDDAANALLAIYTDEKRWKEASALCRRLLKDAARADAGHKAALLRVTVRIALGLGDHSQAVASALQAYQLLPGDGDTARDLVDLCHTLQASPHLIEPARATLDKLTQRGETLDPETWVKLGEVYTAIGEVDAGIEAFVSALQKDEANVPALANLSDRFYERQDWERASSYRLWLARATKEPEAKHAFLVETGEILSEFANNLPEAAWVYEEAAAVLPTDRRVRERLVAIYNELGAWDQLLAAQRALADLEVTQALKAARVRSMAVVALTKQNDVAKAIALFEEVVALDPSRVDALEEIHGILSSQSDTRGLARTHRRYLVNARPELVTTPAVATARGGADVVTLRDRIRKSPLSPSPYRALYGHYRQRGQMDRAYCVAGALVHLGAADSEVMAFYRSFRLPALHEVAGALASRHWYDGLLLPELDSALTAILNLTAQVALRTRTHGKETVPRAYGDPIGEVRGGTASRIARDVKDAARVLGLPSPLLFERAGAGPLLSAAPIQTPALFVSSQAARQLPSDLMPFVVARHVAELHPLFGARAAFRTVSELRMLLDTALRCREERAQSGETARFHAAIRNAMSEDEFAELDALVGKLKGRLEAPDVDGWLHHTNVVCARAGLLMIGSVDAAIRATNLPGGCGSNELRQELLSFAVSEEHMALREVLKLKT
jgi:tetratricopeptide (TPR) repeat protein